MLCGGGGGVCGRVARSRVRKKKIKRGRYILQAEEKTKRKSQLGAVNRCLENMWMGLIKRVSYGEFSLWRTVHDVFFVSLLRVGKGGIAL